MEAIVLAAPAALAVVAWWNVQLRKHGSARDIEALKNDVASNADGLAKLAKVVGAIEKDSKEMSAIVAANRPKLSKFQRGG